MKTVITFTLNPTIDKSTAVEKVIPDVKLRCDQPTFEPGGGGVNVARVIHRLGGKAKAFYTAGGTTGQLLVQLVEREGLEHFPLMIKEFTRQDMMVLDNTTGDQYRFNMPGPALSTEEWQHCLDELRLYRPAPDYIVASGSLPPGVPNDFYAGVARLGKEIGARVIVDTSGPALVEAARAGAYLIKPNLRELRLLTGKALIENSEIESAAREFVSSGQCEVVVISLGAKGAFFASQEASEFIRAPTVRVVSREGAGDSMVGGIVFGLAQEMPLRDAIRLGVAAGTAAVLMPGSELARREDVERLYEEMTAKMQS